MRIFKFIYNFIIPILTSAIGVFLASWLLLQYSEPQIFYYTDGYYQKTNEFSLGEIYVTNEGRKLDNNITLVLLGELPTSSIKIAYTTSPFNIKTQEGRTYITIGTLKPEEGAEIAFQIQTNNTSFEVENVFSDSGNITHKLWINPWWHLTKLQIGLVIFLITIGFGIGFMVGLWKNDLYKRAAQ